MTVGDKVRAFEDLAVFQMARRLTKQIYELTSGKSLDGDAGLRDQIRRASASIISNIAEGCERGGNAELVQFLSIAKGSCGEVRAQLMIASDLGYIDNESHQRLSTGCRRTSAGLANLIKYVRGSAFKGAKYHHQQAKTEFGKLLDAFVPPDASGTRSSNTDQATDGPLTR